MTQNKIISSNDIYFSCMFPEDVITDQRVPRHVIMYIRSGKMLVTDHDRQLEFNAGQTVFIRRDHEVRVFKTGYNGMPYSAVSVIFDRMFLRDYFGTHTNPCVSRDNL